MHTVPYARMYWRSGIFQHAGQRLSGRGGSASEPVPRRPETAGATARDNQHHGSLPFSRRPDRDTVRGRGQGHRWHGVYAQSPRVLISVLFSQRIPKNKLIAAHVKLYPLSLASPNKTVKVINYPVQYEWYCIVVQFRSFSFRSVPICC